MLMTEYIKKQPKASPFSVRNSYKELLEYYYETGIVNKSEITGAMITKQIIYKIEHR